MRYIAAFLLLICSTACLGQASRSIVQPNSWVVVIGAVKECPDFPYRILDIQKMQDRDSAPLVGATMTEITGLSSQEIEAELQVREDLSQDVLPESLKVLVYKAALPPEVLKRLIVQANHDAADECRAPTHRHYQRRRQLGPYQGDGPDDISIEHVKTVT